MWRLKAQVCPSSALEGQKILQVTDVCQKNWHCLLGKCNKDRASTAARQKSQMLMQGSMKMTVMSIAKVAPESS